MKIKIKNNENQKLIMADFPPSPFYKSVDMGCLRRLRNLLLSSPDGKNIFTSFCFGSNFSE